MDIEREIARHKDAVYRQMVRVCGDADDAEDVLMEALISAFRASERRQGRRGLPDWRKPKCTTASWQCWTVCRRFTERSTTCAR